MKLKLDLHVHTIRSNDSHTRTEELIPNIRRTGLDGLAVTDHDILAAELPQGSAIFIPGTEVSSRDGHIIALGVTRAIHKGLPADDTIQEIKSLGGVSIIAHPYDLFRSAVTPENLTVTPDAIEVINSASMLHSITWKRARSFAEKQGIPQTAGSDSHIPQTIGKAFTTVECESKDAMSILAAIRKGHTAPEGRPYFFVDRLRKLVSR